MPKIKKPFWEENYKRPGKLDTFGIGQPNRDVVTAASLLKPGARVLDLGCGEGRNALYLAGMGFSTCAVDISKPGIRKLNSVANDLNLSIDAVVCDMRDYDFGEGFDLIVCHGCLHLIHRDEWRTLLLRMQRYTSSGGFHVVGVFTDSVPEPEEHRGRMIGLFHEGELFEYYFDWEILGCKSHEFEHEHPHGPRHRHSAEQLIARKL